MGRFKMDGGVRKDEISLKEVIFFHRVNPPRKIKKKKKKKKIKITLYRPT
jgi:hypothetical protein